LNENTKKCKSLTMCMKDKYKTLNFRVKLFMMMMMICNKRF
jgi:hypothetical protein